MKNSLIFKKFVNKWYCDLPDYEGDINDLEMVAGADILCEDLPYIEHPDIKLVEILSTNYDETYSETLRPNPNIIKLEFIEFGYKEYNEDSGARYRVSGDNFKHSGLEIWLCDVTKFVFDGEFPEIIYFKPII